MKNKKLLIGFIIGVCFSSLISVGAVNLIYSKDVTYDNTSSGLTSITVQGALDELYESAKNGGAKVSCDNKGECTVTCKQGEPTMNDTGYSCTNTTTVKCPSNKMYIPNNAEKSKYWCALKTITVGNKSIEVVTTGNGLYADTIFSGRYYFRGSNVNNYITFNNETWRIISIESDGSLKIVRNAQLSGTYVWDAAGNRNNSTSTYCDTQNYGCSAWAATSNLIGAPSVFTQYYPNGNTSDSTNYSGTVTKDSTMATYLNGTYYNSLSSTAQAKVVKGTFNVSSPGSLQDTESLEINGIQEAQYQWKGNIALYTITELLRASTDTTCITLKIGNNNFNSSPCKNNNWLWNNNYTSDSFEWTLSPDGNRTSVWSIRLSTNCISTGDPKYAQAIRPVLHLSNNITLSGSGTSSDPYKLN